MAAPTARAAAPPAGADRRAWVTQVMGLPVSIHVRGGQARDPGVAAAVEQAYAELRRADEVFSTYRRDSDLSRHRRGELAVDDADPTVGEVARVCAEARELTGGRFDAWQDGFDPTGLVKGWAVDRTAYRLAKRIGAVGAGAVAVNAGGDIAVPAAGPDAPVWRIGIEDPDRPERVLAVVPVRAAGVATSGTARRGTHIVDPRTGRPADSVRSVTVAGPSLLWADVLATAAFVQGRDALDWIESFPGYAGVVVADGTVAASASLGATLRQRWTGDMSG